LGCWLLPEKFSFCPKNNVFSRVRGLQPSRAPWLVRLWSSVIVYTRAVRSVIPSDNHWPSLVSCCSRNRLEHIACPRPVISIYRNLSPAAEDILVSTVISGHHHLKLLVVIVDFEMAIAILDTLKISD